MLSSVRSTSRARREARVFNADQLRWDQLRAACRHLAPVLGDGYCGAPDVPQLRKVAVEDAELDGAAEVQRGRQGAGQLVSSVRTMHVAAEAEDAHRGAGVPPDLGVDGPVEVQQRVEGGQGAAGKGRGLERASRVGAVDAVRVEHG